MGSGDGVGLDGVMLMVTLNGSHGASTIARTTITVSHAWPGGAAGAGRGAVAAGRARLAGQCKRAAGGCWGARSRCRRRSSARLRTSRPVGAAGLARWPSCWRARPPRVRRPHRAVAERPGLRGRAAHWAPGDLNVDIRARDPGGSTVAVQCKRYGVGHNVGSPEVQTFIGMLFGITAPSVAFSSPRRASPRRDGARRTARHRAVDRRAPRAPPDRAAKAGSSR